ncbi:hypothetical protein Q31a_41750 [Aureliella helgolandensis]|uniref:Uncharacterized protein n=1 Tax=Aureliella helgolandensis TaxID=2527968 RepID=A0A518GBC7_9BACT|nr:hypothetical protein Q31a_41750 [Aureliella helgolandensis]
MQHQVVFQFPGTFFAKHNDLLAFKQKLADSMPKTCDVNGYDAGSGTINFFVYTDSPLAALKHFRTYLGTNMVEKHLRVSYRNVDGDTYTNLWPFRDPRPFDIDYPEGIDPFPQNPNASFRNAAHPEYPSLKRQRRTSGRANRLNPCSAVNRYLD